MRCCFINQTDHGHNQSYTLNLRSQHAIHTGLPSKGQATPPVYCGKERENRPYKMIVYLTSTLLKNGDIQPNPGPQLSAYTDGQLSPAVSPTSVVPAAAGMGDGCMTFGRRRKQTRGIEVVSWTAMAESSFLPRNDHVTKSFPLNAHRCPIHLGP